MAQAPQKLNLASGRHYLPGYWNVDDLSMNPSAVVDQVADIFVLKGFKRHTFEEIRVIHFMMYVRPEEAGTLLKRWYRWLKPGGKLVIETSDARQIAQMILRDASKVEQMFGYGDTAGHRWSYTPQSLKSLISKAGFKSIRISKGGTHDRPDRDFTLIATKS